MSLWNDISSALELTSLTSLNIEKDSIQGAYCGDLLSDVLAKAKPGQLWLTIQKHRNVIAVASLAGLSGVIITGGRLPDRDVIETAEQEGIPLFSTPLDTFTAAGKIYQLFKRYRITGDSC